jgi:mono/diheme cytochrome c family protein
MRTSVARSQGRKSASNILGHLPLVAAFVLMTPVVAFGQDAQAPAASETPAATDTAAVVPAGTVSSYTEEQAARGKTAYIDNCSGCHGTSLGGGGEIPSLAGKGFREHWFVGSPAPFFEYIHTSMPQQDPGSLEPQTYADIASYLMSRNKVPAGDAELPPDDASLANITLPPLSE